VNEAALALLSTCTASGIVFAMAGNIRLFARRRWWSGINPRRHDFWLLIVRVLGRASHFISLISLFSLSLDGGLDFAKMFSQLICLFF
jgi:hypothetical protein